MRNQLIKSVERNYILNMMYLSNKGEFSNRRIQVLQVGDASFVAYCYLRRSKRTFTIANVLALVPVITKESMVI